MNLFADKIVDFKNASSTEMAHAFVDIAFLDTALTYLLDEQWLHKDQELAEIVTSLFARELASLDHLRSQLDLSSKKSIRAAQAEALKTQEDLLLFIKIRADQEQKIFLREALQKMSGLFSFETLLQNERKVKNEHLGFSLYRTFDGLDKIFDLDYEADIGMKQDLAVKERLYEGAGVGVQSGYSTVLTALKNLNLKAGDRFIDLGSGYGRVGLVVGLMHPEVDFIGYEYVPHRVDISKHTTERLEMTNHVHFQTQDLSLKEFHIPEAEIYYMYDPFSEETYGHVLSQLIKFSKYRKITIITKGNARGWLLDVVRKEGWLSPQEFDSGNLCLFTSR
ncbi:hypothetical protein AZI86_08135 [Bdellovibrio bacteriovorus]|uniref:Uncharacterized protein n=1 Tax=Bdellovibrio bacteriovorus TaxID=959 RepID=A0A150WR67_BDEBC|nr:methyltransferase [Bdellovibrio bacteriovorus]KYG66981.1 hypothetical protein AZI86_08135 [Bdellovibrio bacteriovorus]